MLRRMCCLFFPLWILGVVPVSLLGEDGTPLVVHSPCATYRNAELHPVSLRENIGVIDSSIRNDIFASGVKSSNVIGLWEHGIFPSLYCIDVHYQIIGWTKESYYAGIMCGDDALFNRALFDRLRNVKECNAGIRLKSMSRSLADVVDAKLNTQRGSKSYINSSFWMRDICTYLYPRSLVNLLRSELRVHYSVLESPHNSESQGEGYYTPISQTRVLKQFAKRHNDLIFCASILIGVCGGLVAIFGGRYYLRVERNVPGFWLCIGVGIFAFVIVNILAHFAIDID